MSNRPPCCSPRTKTKLRTPSTRTIAYKARTADCGKYLLWKSPLDRALSPAEIQQLYKLGQVIIRQ